MDTLTLQRNYDVDQLTGFMPQKPPQTHLDTEWDLWEQVLKTALNTGLQLGHSASITDAQKSCSECWRRRVLAMPTLPIHEMSSPRLLRRAHSVLAFILHFYVHTLPPGTSAIRIPPSISIPIIELSTKLQIPPVLTYSDNVLYNWSLKATSDGAPPALTNLHSQTLFSGTVDEEEFYLTSARIELRGAEILQLIPLIYREISTEKSPICVKSIISYLRRLQHIIGDLTRLLQALPQSCNPEIYYRDVRPWFNGEDSSSTDQKWIFEGVDTQPTLLSGPSAGQSSLIHALDCMLGVDLRLPTETSKVSFQECMRNYMPEPHRAFLAYLSSSHSLRQFVMMSGDIHLITAFNDAICSLKEFRDAHMAIVALYIVGPSRKAQKMLAEPLKGTGGSDAIRFLKGRRTSTINTVIGQSTEKGH